MSAQYERDHARYLNAMHAVQSAVALDISVNGDNAAAADHKHLRVGINACLVDSGAVAKLLIARGVFTEDEYMAALAEAAEAEQERMTQHLRRCTGNSAITFG